jgi:hypothetical protein
MFGTDSLDSHPIFARAARFGESTNFENAWLSKKAFRVRHLPHVQECTRMNVPFVQKDPFCLFSFGGMKHNTKDPNTNYVYIIDPVIDWLSSASVSNHGASFPPPQYDSSDCIRGLFAGAVRLVVFYKDFYEYKKDFFFQDEYSFASFWLDQ